MEATIKELGEAARRMAAATQPTAEEFAKLGIEINNISNKPKNKKRMKAKEYFKSVGRLVLFSPFIITGIVVLCTAILLKSLGYCLLGDFENATAEIKRL
jgi:hypothetical protein